MNAEQAGTAWAAFPTGLYRTEWSEAMKPDLDALAEAVGRDRASKAMRAAKARCREKFKASTPIAVIGHRLLQRATAGEAPQSIAHHAARSPTPGRFGPLNMPKPTPPHAHLSLPA
jgi:hypothetical protein